jgi:hypothetical protein
MIAHAKQCHDLRMLTSQAERGQSKRMERTPQRWVILFICFVVAARNCLSLGALVTVQWPMLPRRRICCITETLTIQIVRPLAQKDERLHLIEDGQAQGRALTRREMGNESCRNGAGMVLPLWRFPPHSQAPFDDAGFRRGCADGVRD